MTVPEEITALRDRIAAAQSECDTWRASGLQEKYLEAYSRVEALELQLAQLQRRAFESATIDDLPASLSISYNGRHYQCGLYRYDQLADAINYARRHPGEAHVAAVPAAQAMQGPDEAGRQLMASLAITFRDGLYHLGTYRYDRLADAVAYARLQRLQRMS